MVTINQTEGGLPFVVAGEIEYVFGCLPSDPNFSAIPDFSASFTVLPESDWKENSLRSLGLPVRNQGSHGSCTGFATVNAFTAAKLKSAPKDGFNQLSGTYTYAQINNNQDRGASIDQAMLSVINNGICFQSEAPDNEIFNMQFAKTAPETAKRFKALEAYKLNSYEELCSAVTLGIPCAVGFAATDLFLHNMKDSNGIIATGGTVVGGHAVMVSGLKNLGGVWAVEIFNSWTASWGDQGYAYLQKAHFAPGLGFPFSSFAVASVIDDPNDNNDMPPVVMLSDDKERTDDELLERHRSAD